MRKIKEVLRLKYEMNLGQRQIARSCGIGQATVAEYLKRAELAAVAWPLPPDWDEGRLEEAVFGSPPSRASEPQRQLPDFADIRQQLQRHRHLTLQLIWEEYQQQHPDGYRYSYFCELYERWRRKQDVVLRQEHKAGEKMFVDWAGATIPVQDRATGQVWQASLFVAVLGASSYTYAVATRDQQMESWIQAHIRALEFFGGAPKLAIPDNTKTGVTKACRYDPDVNPTYQDLAVHYGFAVLPARPYKPRDKAKVETGVLLAERWIIAALRHRQFFDLAGLNGGIADLLIRLNHRSFRKREGTRASLFETLDKPVLQPLPAERFDLSQWSRARVNIDYHIAFEGNFYSVPYDLVHELMDVRSTPATVEIFHKGQRVASHMRGRGCGQAVTNHEHRPRSHQAHLEWTPSRIVDWARKIGPFSAQVVERILADKPHPEMGYRSCLGIIRLAEHYTPERLEAASERALLTGACRYQSIKSILKNSLDRQPLNGPVDRPANPLRHDNIRGGEYFEGDKSEGDKEE